MKIIAFKSMVFLTIFVLLQALIGYGTMPQPVKDVKKHLAGKTDVIYFGDSVITFYPPTEADREPIVDKVITLSKGDYTAAGIYHPAYNMDVFYSFAEFIHDSKKRPKILVIPINLATFSADWMKPHFQFDMERAILENNNVFYDIFYRPVGIFKKESVSNLDYMNSEVFYGDKPAGKVKEYDNSSYSEFSEEKFKKKIIFRYMYKLHKEQKKIKSMEKLLALYGGTGTKLLFYITPVDYKVCSENIGPDFIKQLDYNRAFLEKLITSGGGSLIDMTYALPSEIFAWKSHSKYVNEHVNLKGRQYIAAVIDREIRKVLKPRQ